MFNCSVSAAAVAGSVVHEAVGVSYMLLATVCALPYAAILYVMASRVEFRSRACYVLLVHLGLCDLLQLAGHFVVGAITALPLCPPIWLITTIGGVHNGAWLAYCLLMFAVALNRTLVILQCPSNNTLFSPAAVRVYIALVWLLVAVFWAACQTKLIYFNYSLKDLTWHYDLSGAYPYSWYMLKFELLFCTSTIVAAMLCYLTIFVYVNRASHNAPCVSSHAGKREINIALQATLVTCVAAAELFSWHVVTSVLHPSSVLYFVLVQYVWLANSAVNPVIYMLLNSKLRDAVRVVFCAKRQDEASSRSALQHHTPRHKRHSVCSEQHPPRALVLRQQRRSSLGDYGSHLLQSIEKLNGTCV